MYFQFEPNEPVEKVLLTSENDVFGGHLILRKYKIVDYGAFCEVIYFTISSKNLLGDFFYSLNGSADPHGQPALLARCQVYPVSGRAGCYVLIFCNLPCRLINA
jgi:hypothetical protein